MSSGVTVKPGISGIALGGGGGNALLFRRGLMLNRLRRLSRLVDVSESTVVGLKLEVDLDLDSFCVLLPVSLDNDLAVELVSVVEGNGK